MNRTAVSNIDWSRDELRDYFGLGKGKKAPYLLREPFTPATLSQILPKQLHETDIHPCGVPVHLEGGRPALRKDVVGMLDAVPYAIMREAVDYLRQYDKEAWRAMNAAWDRYPLDTIPMLAERCGCDRSTFYRRLDRGLQTISSYVDRVLSRQEAGNAS